MGVKLRRRKLKSGGESLFLDICHNGVRTTEFLNAKLVKKGKGKDIPLLGAEKLKIAERIRAQRELEILAGSYGMIPNHIKSINFFDFAQNFIDTYQKKDKRMITSATKKFRSYWNGDNLRIDEVTPDVMQGFKTYLENDPALSGESGSNYWTRFKKILKSAKIKGLIKSMPTEDIRYSNPNKGDTIKKDVLTINEIRLLANTKCGNEAVKRAFLFCCFTGLGLAEIRVLKWKNIREGRLIINRQKTGSRIDNFLKEETLELLGDRGDSDSFIFPLQKISHVAYNKNLRNWAKRAKIDKHLSSYVGRHTYSVLLLMNGANIKSVADALGHSGLKNVTKYLNHVDRLKDEAINNLPSFK